MQSSQSMYNLSSISSPQYVPSHLRQSHRNSQTRRVSPPRIRRSSTTGRFGGPSFGTPRASRASLAHDASLEDAPPTESFYDYNGGSPFSTSQSKPALATTVTQQKEVPTLASVPSAVIIFGFPAQITTKVLDYFSRFGNIQEHSSSSAAQNLSMGSNWMKITYEKSAAAQQAVAANGTMIAGQYMVGCVFAQDDPLASIDTQRDGDGDEQVDAMDIDPQTPPRPKSMPLVRPASQDSPSSSSRNASRPSSGHASTTPFTPAGGGGRRIEVLSSEAIYQSTSPFSERAVAWLPSWLSSSTEQPASHGSGSSVPQAQQGQSSWPIKMARNLLDTIFGF